MKKAKNEPLTISCSADIHALFDEAQLSVFRAAVKECPQIFESEEDFLHRLCSQIDRGMPIEEAKQAVVRMNFARGWSIEI